MRTVQRLLCLLGKHAPGSRRFQDDDGRLMCRCQGCERAMIRDRGMTWTVAK